MLTNENYHSQTYLFFQCLKVAIYLYTEFCYDVHFVSQGAVLSDGEAVKGVNFLLFTPEQELKVKLAMTHRGRVQLID